MALLLSAAFAAGCSSNDGKSGATPTQTATKSTPVDATSTPAGVRATPTPAPDIKQEDFTKEPAVSLYVSTSGGKVDTAGIMYADLTQDGADEAVVPISSSGESGHIAVFVFGYGPEGLTELLRVAPSPPRLSARVVGDQLQVDEPQFAPGDPLCCPSQLQRTTYAWDGTTFVIGLRETVPSGT